MAPHVPKLNDLHACTEDVPVSHNTSSLVPNIFARIGHKFIEGN